MLGDKYGSLELVYSFERTALGTGGALRNAADLLEDNDVLAMNGDSFCDIDLRALERAHRSYGAAVTLAALLQSDRRRSGAVTVDDFGLRRCLREPAIGADAGPDQCRVSTCCGGTC